MKISTKGRYGMRALLDLAVHSGNDMTTLADIAGRQEISVGYLEQIFSALRKANIVLGTKGAQGGYILAQPAERIAVQHILGVLEGDLLAIKDDKTDAPEAFAMQAVIREKVWDQMTGAVSDALDGLTLQDLADAYVQSRMQDTGMFYI